MAFDNPELGDIVMLLRAEIRQLPPKVRRGRPPKIPRIETETTWHDDIEAVVVKGPSQGISCDGEDYWLEWTVQRLDNLMYQVITTESRRASGPKYRIISKNGNT